MININFDNGQAWSRDATNYLKFVSKWTHYLQTNKTHRHNVGQVYAHIHWWRIITLRPMLKMQPTRTRMFFVHHVPSSRSICYFSHLPAVCLWIIMEKPLRDSLHWQPHIHIHTHSHSIAFQFSNKFDNEWNDYLLIYLYCCCCYCYSHFYGFCSCVSSFLHVHFLWSCSPSILSSLSFGSPVSFWLGQMMWIRMISYKRRET